MNIHSLFIELFSSIEFSGNQKLQKMCLITWFTILAVFIFISENTGMIPERKQLRPVKIP
jgi:hypothetical protein